MLDAIFLRLVDILFQGGKSDSVVGQVVNRVDVRKESITDEPSGSQAHAVGCDQGG